MEEVPVGAWVYILRLHSGQLYVGATTDIERRWRECQRSLEVSHLWSHSREPVRQSVIPATTLYNPLVEGWLQE
jgi:hypothetical protein